MADSGEKFEQVAAIRDFAPVARVACVDAIRERKGDVLCFNPGLLCTHGGLPIDPVREFATRFSSNEDAQPFCVALPPHARPFFHGIGISRFGSDVVDWDRRLYGIDKTRAAVCFDFLGGIGMSGADFFASSVQHQIDIPDPTSPLSGNKPIRVYAFGVLIADTITYIASNGFNVPCVATTPAAPHIAASSKFKITPFTEEQFNKLRG
jgi:hypothetical protein